MIEAQRSMIGHNAEGRKANEVKSSLFAAAAPDARLEASR